MKLSKGIPEVLVVALVVSSLVVRVLAPGGGGPGFRLAFEGEIAGARAGTAGSLPLVVAIAARRGSARSEARGVLEPGECGRFRLESGLLGGSGEYAFRLSVGETELYCGSVTVEGVGVGFAVAREHMLDSAILWFDDSGAPDAPMLACTFWYPGEGALAGLKVVLSYNGRSVLGSDDPGLAAAASPSRKPSPRPSPHPGLHSTSGVPRSAADARIVDSQNGPDPAVRCRQVQLRFPGARAFVLGEASGVHDLSAHPGVYGIQVALGQESILRLSFEVDWHGVVRESGPVECRADGTRVMLLGRGRRFGPPPQRGATTLDPVYARYFTSMRGPHRVVLDDVQCGVLDHLISDLMVCEGAVPFLDAEMARATLHDLLTRVEEFESLLPGDHPVPFGDEEVPFERLRTSLLRQLALLDGDSTAVTPRG